MRNSIIQLVVLFLLCSCVVTNKMANEAIRNAIVGQNETIVYSRLGPPASYESAPDGEKIATFEYHQRGMFLTPSKSQLKYSAKRDVMGNREGLSYNAFENTATNDPKFTIYDRDVYYLIVYFDKRGTCIRFEHNLPRKQLEKCYERYKGYPAAEKSK